MELVWATWRKDSVGLESRMHSTNGAESSVLSAWSSAMILSSSASRSSAKCLLRNVGSSLPSSSMKGFAVVSGNPGIDLSVELGRLVRKDGTGIWSDISRGGEVGKCTVAILLFEIAVKMSLIALARVDLPRISLHSQLMGRPFILDMFYKLVLGLTYDLLSLSPSLTKSFRIPSRRSCSEPERALELY